MKNETLKPCPFCGGEAEIVDLPDNHLHAVAIGCINSKCNARISGSTIEEAITAWNRRHQETREIVVDCENAEKTQDGKCRGYQVNEYDDEPSKPCKYCSENIFYKGAGGEQ